MESFLEVDKVDEVYLRIRNLTQNSAMEIKEFFSCYIENRWFNPLVRAKRWDGKISLYDWKNQTIPIGLFPQFIKFCQKFGYQYKVNFNREEILNDISDDEFEKFYDAIFADTSYSPRDYQDECIKKSLRMKRGVIECPTASGKSLIIYSIIRFLLGIAEGKILLIVPNISLVNQMFSDFKDYGWKYCESNCALVFHKSKRINWECPVIISTWQSIYKRGIDFFGKFQAVIVDETHGAKSDSIQSCLKKCINAEYRIGLTGTMPEELINQFTIYGYLGPKLFEMTSSELIEKGILSKIKIANLLLQYPKETIYSYWHDDEGDIQQKEYQEELDIIYGNPDRNKIFKYIINRLDKTQNILILCHKISHLKDIKKYLEDNFKERQIFEIYGQTEADERERIRQLTNVQGSTIILGTFATVGQGLNIPRLHHIIFASSYRTRIKIIQAIGRGLRKHLTKERLIVFDLIDDLTWFHNYGDQEILHINHTYSHWLERLKHYKQ